MLRNRCAGEHVAEASGVEDRATSKIHGPIEDLTPMPSPLSQFLILVNQGHYFLVQSLALAVGLIRARSW